jgi:predicted hotdog family 3-hydroxylacyl-ACP dehydratase
MSTAVRWSLLDVLPQKPPMVLLDSIVSHDGKATVCSVLPGPRAPFADADGAVPAHVALEYMAQCAAAHSGIVEREKGRAIRLGFLLGSRRATFHVPRFPPGRELRVTARVAWDDGELASFECKVEDGASGALLAEGELSAYSPHDLQDLLARQKA